MPFLTSRDARIHYQVTGSGEPIVLIMGLGWDMTDWESLLPHLDGYQVLRVDNRGAGLSEVPNRPYSIPMMAADTIAVMDEVGIGRAHIYGASLGSMIAQEIALSYPSRVATLILGCPSPGVIAFPGAPGLATATLMRNRRTPEESVRRTAKYIAHRPESREALMTRLRERGPANPIGYKRQLTAVFRWSSLSRLRKIRVPTLIIHGTRDRLLPVSNGRLIARLIPGARIEEIQGCGHVYSFDAPGVSAELVVKFLRANRQAS